MAEFDPSQIYVALDDVPLDDPQPQQMLNLVNEYGLSVKIGISVGGAIGWRNAIDEIKEYTDNVFVDTKFKEIPTSVYKAVLPIFEAKPRLVDMYASAETAALEAFLLARRKAQGRANKNLASLAIGVTELTSTPADETKMESGRNRWAQVQRLTNKVIDLGFDGVTCSGKDLYSFQRYLKYRSLLKVAIGIRPEWANANDQEYTITPSEAIKYGADFMVIGRPITHPPRSVRTPAKAIEKILQEIEAV